MGSEKRKSYCSGIQGQSPGKGFEGSLEDAPEAGGL